MDDANDFFSSNDAEIFLGLNAQQAQAVSVIDGPLMILAGPGSGKTRVITHRIAYMLQQGVPAERILALTFTNKAANELGHRIQRLVPGQFVWAGTFHRFCSRLLRQYGTFVGLSDNFSILDMDDATKLFSQVWDEAKVQDDFVSTAAVQSEISNAKNALIRPEDYRARVGNPAGKVVEKIYPLYQKKLVQCNSVDFDDLLLWTAIILQENEELRERLDERFAYIMVDEYQDTNLAQYAIVRSLSNDYPNLAVTGDPDQSIYGWRGANIGNILGFERDYPNVQVVRLEQNYRSTQKILGVADRLIANNRLRKPKRLIATQEVGQPVRMKSSSSPQDEALWISSEIKNLISEGVWEPKDFAIFYRANWLSRNLEHELTAAGIPYQLVNGFEFYQRKEIKDLIAYLRLIVNPKNDVAFERVVNSPARKIGKVTLDRLHDMARASGASLLEVCQNALQQPSSLGRAASSIQKFVAQIQQLQTVPWNNVRKVLESVLEVTSYAKILEADQTEMSSERLGNIDELLTAAAEFDKQHPEDGGLEAYLETAALVSDTDKLDGDVNHVKMMTMHAAKGLEFPCVYIVGVEEGILPHERSSKSEKDVEEERRLFFVGITRAQKELTLCHCEGRMRRGTFAMCPPSSFLMEVLGPELERVRPSEYKKSFGHWQNESRSGFRPPKPTERDWVEDECGGSSFDIADYEDNDDRLSNGSLTKGNESAAPKVSRNQAPDPSRGPARGIRESATSFSNRISTAAEMFEDQDLATELGEKASATSDGHEQPAFCVGGLVQHPEYGPGKIVALSGSPAKPYISVYFFSVGPKKFRADFCDLRVISNPRN
ncbi:MAG: UvrD-helicase domain-containing protein [Planctomycetaceae bacterium]|nr:UvrD-helicase domain-containing protein [Planctomycetaceae bacterium]